MAVVAIDWDNTLMDGAKWLEGAKDAIRRLREEGHKVVIHSCNNPGWIEKNLNEAGLVVDMVWERKHGSKPLADLYVDDRGYDFKGDWSVALEEILNHRHVNTKDNRKW